MNPPKVYELTSPRSQSTSKITNIVQSIGLFLSVKAYLASHEPLPLRLWEREIPTVSPSPRANSSCSLPANCGLTRNHIGPVRRELAPRDHAILCWKHADRSSDFHALFPARPWPRC